MKNLTYSLIKSNTVALSENTAELAAESAAKPAPRRARNHD